MEPVVRPLDEPEGERPFRAGDRDALLLSTTRRLVRELGAAAVTVFLHVPGTAELRAAAVAVTPLGVGSIERVSVDDEVYPSARAWRTGRVATAHSASIMAGHPMLSVFAPFPYQASAAPLASATRRFGTLTAFWLRANGRTDPGELERLGQAASALAARLDELAHREIPLLPPAVPLVTAVEEMGEGSGNITPSTAPLIYHLHKLAIRLADAPRAQDVIDWTIERARDGFLARAAVITLVDGERLHLAGAAGCSAEYLRTAEGALLGQTSPEAEAITSRRQKLYGPMDRRTRGRLADEAADAGCFWAVLPLSTGRLPTGALSLAFATERTDIIAEEATLTALATTVAQGLERARTNETRHALAEALQQTLLPRMLPQPAGVVATSRYASATSGIELGGDWYDLITLPGGKIVMAIGDVEGHNTSAAVVMGQLRSAVRAYACEGHDPARILERANRVLVDLDTDLYATCCCALLDPDTGALQMATAGHPPPAVRTADGAATEWDLDVGMPLGVDAEVRFEAAEMQLAPGTLLAFYTDGLVGFADALDPEALQEVFRGGSNLEALGDGLIARFDNLHTRHTDDAALMLVLYEGPSSEARENVRQIRIHRRDLQGAQRTRRLLREWLEGWGLSGMIDEEELLVSEIVTNGLVHGDSDVHVYVRRYPERVRVEVRDSDPRPARTVTVPREEDQAEGGRGLVIVSALASAWGNSPSGRGKTVWFELPVPDARH
ncbi:SpoIIE family protein phosphatase [Streptomyces sp. NPDC020794]|uniref:ATP-binding SpoIIE family protein phosphatase n=1 Tax=unclassified Streptomyces TaxID=2593676 RepID=UPI0036E1D1D6